MNYAEALDYLGAARRFGMKPGLGPMQAATAALGHPEEKLRFIHLAGTNGKGSTAAFCESCLRAAGFRVGLYTSPHLVSVRERIQIDRRLISEDDFAEGVAAVREKCAGLENAPSTFFEIVTGVALRYLAAQAVDWVVWETGLGGRLDATNIVRPEVSVITHLGLDHQQYLGSTLREIAAEKAGIIKPGVPVVSAVRAGEAAEVIRDRARAVGAPVTWVPRDLRVENSGLRGDRQFARIDGDEFALGLIGAHQIENAACAIAALRRLPATFPKSVLRHGLEKTAWPGRFEIVSSSPLIVLDGAHNPAGLRALVETWQEFLASRGISGASAHVVFGSVTDKDVAELARLLRPLAEKVSLVRLANERSAEPAALARHFGDVPCRLYDSVGAWWQQRDQAPGALPVLCTGSLFLAGEILAQRGGDGAAEYRLNERLESSPTIR